MQKSMMCIHSSWNKGKTFRMIPVHVDCPYNEVIYDKDQHVLAVISKECKEAFQLVPKMTEKGYQLIQLQHQCYDKHSNPERILESIVLLTYEFWLSNHS